MFRVDDFVKPYLLSRFILENVLLVMALVYAFFGLGFTKEIKHFMVCFYLLTLTYVVLYRRLMLKSAYVYLFIAAALITVLSWYFTQLDGIPFAKSSPNTKPLLDKFVFIPLAVVLMGSKRKVGSFLTLAILSAILLPWTKGDGVQEFTQFLSGKRTGFGGHVITMGINYALILLAGISLIYYSFKSFSYKITVMRYVQPIVGVLLITVGVIGVLGSQTRAVYLGLLVVLFGAVSLATYRVTLQKKKSHVIMLVSLLMLIVISINFAHKVPYIESVTKRVVAEKKVVSAVLKLDFNVPRNSAGLRVHFWKESLLWISKRPIVGWGYGAAKELHIESGNRFKGGYFNTIHNDFLEIFLSYGLIGLLFLMVLLFKIIGDIRLAGKQAFVPRPLYTYFYLFLILFIINSLFMSLLFYSETKFSWSIVIASLLTFCTPFNLAVEKIEEA